MKLIPRGFFSDLYSVIPLAIALPVYFYINPVIPLELVGSFYTVWIICFVLDANITVKNAQFIHREKNFIFPKLYRKFGPVYAPVIQWTIELAAVFGFPLIFVQSLTIDGSSFVGFIFGIAHLTAYISNVKVLRNFRGQGR